MDRLLSLAILLAALGCGLMGGFFFAFSNTVMAALGCGLMGGFFFAFSNTVMAALGRLPAEQGAAGMQSINAVVTNPLFFVAFFGTPLLCAILAVVAVTRLGAPGSYWLLAGAASTSSESSS